MNQGALQPRSRYGASKTEETRRDSSPLSVTVNDACSDLHEYLIHARHMFLQHRTGQLSTQQPNQRSQTRCKQGETLQNYKQKWPALIQVQKPKPALFFVS